MDIGNYKEVSKQQRNEVLEKPSNSRNKSQKIKIEGNIWPDGAWQQELNSVTKEVPSNPISDDLRSI